MITAANTPAPHSQLRVAYNRRLTELLDAQKEIARLLYRVRNLQIENKLLSERLAEKEANK